MSSIADDIERSFADVCVSSRREEAVQLLHLPDNHGHIVIDMLAKLLISGSKIEVEAYLRKAFMRLPEGLKLKLIKTAMHIAGQQSLNTGSNTLTVGLKSLKQFSWRNQVHSSWSRWEQGQMTLVDLFHDLARFLYEGTLEPSVYHVLVNKLLKFGGHLCDGRLNVYKTLPVRSIFEIRQVRLSACLTRIYLDYRDDSMDIFDARTTDFLKSHLADGYTAVNSDPLVRWRLDANLREILAYSQGPSGARIDIGRTVRHGKGLIEVESVVSVDAKVVADWRVFSIVLKGRWLNPDEQTAAAVASAGEGVYGDGASDICRHDEAGGNHSPNDSSYEIDQRFFPSHDYPCQYFVLFASAWAGLVKVERVVDMLGCMDIDQEVTGISLPAHNACFLYGSHGLLVYLYKEKEGWQAPYRLVFDDFMYDDVLPTQPSPHNPGYSFVTHSHSSRGDIVRIAYRDSKGGKGRLASADSLGVICVWELSSLPLATAAVAPHPFYEPLVSPLPVARYQLHRECYITLLLFGGQSGEVLYVGTNDRLFVLTWEEDAEGGVGVKSMRELALLDLSPHSWPPTLYVLLAVNSYLRIWRLRELEEGGEDGQEGQGGVQLTSWHHLDTSPWLNLNTGERRDQHHKMQQDNAGSAEDGPDAGHHPSSLTFLALPQESKPPKVVMVLPPMRMQLSSRAPSSFTAQPLQPPPSRPPSSYASFVCYMDNVFSSPLSPLFRLARPLLSLMCVAYQPLALDILAGALGEAAEGWRYAPPYLDRLVHSLAPLLTMSALDSKVRFGESFASLSFWLTCPRSELVGGEGVGGPGGLGYFVDKAVGHNLATSLFLSLGGNKSVCVEPPANLYPPLPYLQRYGPLHLRHTTRALRETTMGVRKLDETANIRGTLPPQLGFIGGLQEVYMRRVGLGGSLPSSLGKLKFLRVLSLGNNRLTGTLPPTLAALPHLQRIVLHQNNLAGQVPALFASSGCIVNLAGNPLLEHGEDVPRGERQALADLYERTGGPRWAVKTNWGGPEHVAQWYKVRARVIS